MEEEIEDGEIKKETENEDPSWTPEEVDDAYKKGHDDDDDSSKPR